MQILNKTVDSSGSYTFDSGATPDDIVIETAANGVVTLPLASANDGRVVKVKYNNGSQPLNTSNAKIQTQSNGGVFDIFDTGATGYRQYNQIKDGNGTATSSIQLFTPGHPVGSGIPQYSGYEFVANAAANSWLITAGY